MVRIDTGLRALGHLVSLLAFASLFPHLDLPVQILIPAVFAVGGISDYRGRYLVSPRVATLLSLAAFVVYAAQISRTDPVAPLVNMLVLLLGVRLVTEKAPRHYLQIFVLALFALAGSSLLSLSAAYLVFLIIQVVLVSLGLVLLCFFASDRDLALPRPDLRRTLAVAVVLPLGSLVLMLFFFAILPRTRYPLWNFLNPVGQAVTGIGDTVSPGSVAQLAETQTVAFRADGDQLPPEDLYWRVVVLNQPAGTVWSHVEPPVEERNGIEGGRLTRQTVYPEPKSDGRLMALDLPQKVIGAGAVRRTGELMLIGRPLHRRIKYDTVSTLDGRLRVQGAGDPGFYLRLPDNISPRIRDKAAEIKARSKSPEEVVENLRRFFSGQNLVYATSGVPTGDRPLESFLFDTKRGYCEFFASSFALMLRLAGIPARLVGGYHGGTYNELAGYYLVTENAAHVWVEALVDGTYWRRIDPSLLSANAAKSLGASRPALVGTWGRWLDLVNYYWTQAVITYDLDRQVLIFRKVQGSLGRIEWRVAINWCWIVTAGVCGGFLFLIEWLRRRFRSPEEHLLKMFLRVAQRRLKLQRIPPGMGLEDLALRMEDIRAREFVAVFGAAVYRDRPLSRDQARYLRRLIYGLRRPGAEGRTERKGPPENV